jgi:hypothetical protein
MNKLNEPTSDLEALAPFPDEAINELEEDNRKAILLRFYERLDFRAVGEALGISENAAQKRVSRALEQLHAIVTRRGSTLSAAALGTALAAGAISTAPAGLAPVVVGWVLASLGTSGAVTVSSFLAMPKLKFTAFSLIGILGLGIPLVVQQRSLTSLRDQNAQLRSRIAQITTLAGETERLSNLLAQANAQTPTPGNLSELLRLRGEVARLRGAHQKLEKLEKPAGASENKAEASPQRSIAPQFFYVTGEVVTPGRFVWSNGMSLASALVLAHGLTDLGNHSVVQVKGPDGSDITVNYQDVTDLTGVVEPGTRLFVPRAEATGSENP